MQKFSRQREVILRVLRETDSHPTAAWVYARARQILPHISLGTVYRNLDRLRADGEILRLSVGDSTEHFDGNVAPHLHFCCTSCRRISDLPLPPGFDPALLAGAENRVTGCQLLLYGVCRQCAAHGNDTEIQNKRRSIK